MQVPVLLSNRSPLLLPGETWAGVLARLALYVISVVVAAAVFAMVGLAAVLPWVAR